MSTIFYLFSDGHNPIPSSTQSAPNGVVSIYNERVLRTAAIADVQRVYTEWDGVAGSDANREHITLDEIDTTFERQSFRLNYYSIN